MRLVGGVQPEACLTVEAALASRAAIAERPSFDLAGAPGEGDVLAYALALMRLRDREPGLRVVLPTVRGVAPMVREMREYSLAR